MTEERPVINRLQASCCDLKFVNFELPSIGHPRLEQTARSYGWIIRGGNWICTDHQEQK